MLSSGTGQSNDARKFYEKSIEIQSSAVRDNPSVTIYRRDLAAHYHNYGMLLLANRETNTALENVEKSLAIREDLVRTDPTDNQFVSELARSFYQYGMVKKHASQFADALASFEKGIAIQESLVSRFPQSPSYRIDLVYSYTIVCDVLIRTGHFRKAHEWLSKSLEVAKVHSENYFNFEVTQQIGQSSTRFAATCPDTELSIQFLESGIEWYSLVLRVHPDDIAKLREVAFLWNTLLGLVVKSRNPRERFENLDAKLAGTYSDLKAIKSFKSLLHNAFAWWLASAPVRDKADYMKAVDLAHSALEPNPNAGGILNTLGVAQYRAGMVREASETLRKSLELNNAAAKGVEQPGDLAFLAMALFELDRKDEAQATYARLVEAMKDPKLANDRENRQFYREATNLIHPMTLPDVPAIFQPIHP
jgi:tetratricopeptide (TPR) repeat protein